MPLDTQTEVLHSNEARFKRARLSVIKGPDKGIFVMLEGQPVVVGSDESCELKLSDVSVSRRHLELSGGPGGYRVRDLRSTNGVVIEGVQVMDGKLLERATLTLGRTQLRFEPERAEVTWPLSASDRFGEVWGMSVPMRRLFSLLERAAAVETPLVLEAELGCETEALARAVHRVSSRAKGPFISIDAVTIPEDTADDVLAEQLEEAEGGVCFIEDAAALGKATQGALARAIDVSREDESGPRFILSLRAPVEALRRAGTLVDSLALAASALVVRVPALRERTEDIAGLAAMFASKQGTALSDETKELLTRHDWPGNVRELRNVVERLAALPEADVALGSLLDPPTHKMAAAPKSKSVLDDLLALPYHLAKERLLERFERAFLTENLKVEKGVVTRAAQRMQLPRQTVHRLMKRLGLGSHDE